MRVIISLVYNRAEACKGDYGGDTFERNIVFLVQTNMLSKNIADMTMEEAAIALEMIEGLIEAAFDEGCSK